MIIVILRLDSEDGGTTEQIEGRRQTVIGGAYATIIDCGIRANVTVRVDICRLVSIHRNNTIMIMFCAV